MIWVRGTIVEDHALTVSVLDRTFEHGLGLFETLRTWNGHPTLLPRHLARLRRSASELGLPLDPADLPHEDAVAALCQAEGRVGDVLLRITMSGGLSSSSGSVVWMRSSPLPAAIEGGVTIREILTVDSCHPLDRHKSLNYWGKRIAYQRALAGGADEVLTGTEDGRVLEGSRTSLFAIERGRLVTPDLAGPLLPGIMRAVVIEQAPKLGLTVSEDAITRARLMEADEVFLSNSVRGIVPVRQLLGRALPAPGPWTGRLWDDLREWLSQGDGTP